MSTDKEKQLMDSTNRWEAEKTELLGLLKEKENQFILSANQFQDTCAKSKQADEEKAHQIQILTEERDQLKTTLREQMRKKKLLVKRLNKKTQDLKTIEWTVGGYEKLNEDLENKYSHLESTLQKVEQHKEELKKEKVLLEEKVNLLESVKREVEFFSDKYYKTNAELNKTELEKFSIISEMKYYKEKYDKIIDADNNLKKGDRRNCNKIRVRKD